MGLKKSILLICAVLSAVSGGVVPVSAQIATAGDGSIVVGVEAGDDVEMVAVSGPTLIDVTANDSSDFDYYDAQLTVIVQPSEGTVRIGTEGQVPVVEYTPTGTVSSKDSFEYRTCVDGACDTATVVVYLGTRGCTITGTNRADKLIGTEGDDVICGRKGNDFIDGLGGDDILLGGDGDDLIIGKSGADRLDGGEGNDVLRGNRGSDELYGNGGDDTLFGGHGNDTLSGGPGMDLVEGNGGTDTCSTGETYRTCESTDEVAIEVVADLSGIEEGQALMGLETAHVTVDPVDQGMAAALYFGDAKVADGTAVVDGFDFSFELPDTLLGTHEMVARVETLASGQVESNTIAPRATVRLRPGGSTHTVFAPEEPIALSVLIDALSASDTYPVEFTHELADGVGGFYAWGLTYEDAYDVYLAHYSEEHGGEEPFVSSFTITGDVDQVDLGGVLGAVQAERLVVDLTEVGAEESPVGGQRSGFGLLAEDESVVPDFVPEVASLDVWSVGLRTHRKHWPLSDVTRPEMRFSHVLIADPAFVTAMDGRVYEHDIKLKAVGPVEDLVGDPPANFWPLRDKRPFCNAQNTAYAFMAHKEGGVYWDSNFPYRARPYIDTDASDSCADEDLSWGLLFPGKLDADKAYYINVYYGAHVRPSGCVGAGGNRPNQVGKTMIVVYGV